jgi:hypothetical protein
MEENIILEIPVRGGHTMTVECSAEFLRRVKEQIGYDDEAAIRQFIHNAVTHAIDDRLKETLPGV